MRGDLKKIQRRLDVTAVYVTHDQTEAMTVGDRIAVLKVRARRPAPLSAVHAPDCEQLGLRPEHLRLTAPDQGVWRARLELITSLGSERL